MGWVDDLRGKVVGLDTAPVIYYIERKSPYVEMLRPFFRAVDEGEISAVTSIITLLEALVHPLRQNNVDLAGKYREILLNSKGFTTHLLSQEIAEEAAQSRSISTIRTPDAIQMATAIYARASFFLTNDMGLPSLGNLNV